MIDAHLHFQDCFSPEDEAGGIALLRSLGVKTLAVNATSPADWDRVARLADQYPGDEAPEVIPFFGIHPWKVGEMEEGWEDGLSRILARYPAAGVGEIGLDKWITGHDLPIQREMFGRQLEIAASFARPVTVHCLQAWGSLFECMQESAFEGAFLLHSYGGPGEMIADWVKEGAYFSLSGYFFREAKREKLEVFASIPEDRILLETDAPDMSFDPGRSRYEAAGGKNHPANIELVYESYARFCGRSREEVVARMRRNFRSFNQRTPPVRV